MCLGSTLGLVSGAGIGASLTWPVINSKWSSDWLLFRRINDFLKRHKHCALFKVQCLRSVNTQTVVWPRSRAKHSRQTLSEPNTLEATVTGYAALFSPLTHGRHKTDKNYSAHSNTCLSGIRDDLLWLKHAQKGIQVILFGFLFSDSPENAESSWCLEENQFKLWCCSGCMVGFYFSLLLESPLRQLLLWSWAVHECLWGTDLDILVNMTLTDGDSSGVNALLQQIPVFATQ